MIWKQKINLNYIILFLLFLTGFFTDSLIKNDYVVIRLFDILLLIILIFYCVKICSLGQIFERTLKNITELMLENKYFILLFFLFVCWMLASVLWNSSLFAAVKNTLQYFELFFLTFIIMFICRQVNLQLLLKILYLALVVITICFMLINFLNGNFINLKNSSAKIIPGFAAALTFCYFLFKKNKFKWGIILFWFGLFALLTMERKSWVAFAFAGLIQFVGYNIWFTRKETRRTNLNLIIILLVCILIGGVLFNVNPFFHKKVMSLTTIFDQDYHYSKNDINSVTQRRLTLKTAFIAFKEAPFLGIGVGREKQTYNRIVNTNDGIPSYNIHTAHNEFVTIGVEMGTVGLIIYILLWCYPLIGILRRMIKYKNEFNLRQKKNGIFILGIWSYGIIVNMFRATGLLNMMFLFVPISLYLIFKFEVEDKYASKERERDVT